MNKEGFTFFIAIIVLLFLGSFTSAQNTKDQTKLTVKSNYPYKLTMEDSIQMVSLPELCYDAKALKKLLPSELNNSTQPYFMPIFEQVSLECGQQSGISYTFGYEWNYRNGTSADIPENQFPTHFTFNFMNGGYGWTGVSYMHSFEIAKVNGHPTVEEYGGMNNDDETRWMSGYDSYYNGMTNKIEEVYQIKVGTPEGLLVLKNWLHNHLNDEEVGGIACFYSANPWNPTTLPAGTPEAGKHVITLFPGLAGHANTIVGYHDSIRYDYNQDGQYTNHIDINNDGEVNLKDWEIGGLLITEGYNGGVNWADSSFCYIMYKTLAEKDGEGGIWNNCVHVVTVKTDYEPLLTMKIKLKHIGREQIKISAGVSSPSNAPKIMSFPLFNFQGGFQYMQGGTDPDALEIELGLDITPLLGNITSGEESPFFLIVEESDPYGWGNGSISSFSVIDYTNGINETVYPQQNIELINNDQTVLSLQKTIEFDQVSIITNSLPSANTGEPYSNQMENTGGTAPYKWSILHHFEESQSVHSFPNIDDEILVFDDTIKSTAFKKIDFEFPFFGKHYDSIWIHTDGFIMFDDQDFPWPYMFDENLMVKRTRNISPMLNKFMYIDVNDNDGVRYTGGEDYAAFQWKMSCNKNGQSDMNFALWLYPSGKIDFYYDQGNTFLFNYYSVGYGAGDNTNVKYSQSLDISASQPQKITFEPATYPEEMSISEDGVFMGTPLQDYFQVPIDFQITDNSNIADTKTLYFSSGIANVEDGEVLKNNIHIFPNPTNGLFYVEFDSKDRSDIYISLIDVTGKTLAKLKYEGPQNGSQKWPIDLGKIVGKKDGIYYLIFERNDFSPSISKLVYFSN